MLLAPGAEPSKEHAQPVELSAAPVLVPCHPSVQNLCIRVHRTFVVQDMVIFMGLLSDLFPSTNPARKRDFEFEKVIVKEAEKAGLTPEDDYILRIVQFSELLAIRHCVFLMGPTGSGRSEVYRLGVTLAQISRCNVFSA